MSKSSTKNARITRERLVESHLPLVRSLARRYAGQGESLDDLVQVGAVGLVKAGNRFDKSRGVAFATFAGPVIEGEIRRHLRDRSTPMRIPRDLQRASGELRRQQGRLTAAIGRSPSTGELAAALNTDEERIERALRAGLAREALPLPGDEEDLAGSTTPLSRAAARIALRWPSACARSTSASARSSSCVSTPT
jgi:RNA polymerase sigma-B factor